MCVQTWLGQNLAHPRKPKEPAPLGYKCTRGRIRGCRTHTYRLSRSSKRLLKPGVLDSVSCTLRRKIVDIIVPSSRIPLADADRNHRPSQRSLFTENAVHMRTAHPRHIHTYTHTHLGVPIHSTLISPSLFSSPTM